MRLFDPDPDLRWLFVLPHPDDELAICAWIRRLRQAGATVRLQWVHSTPVREQESRTVATHLGLGADQLSFFTFADGQVIEHLAELASRLREVVESFRPDRVVAPAFEQGHLDHDATNLAVNLAFAGPILEVPLYHPYSRRIQTLNRFADPAGQEVLRLTAEERRLKARLARAYPSQTLWRNVFWYEVWQRMRLQFDPLSGTERMRLQVWKRFLEPNLPPAQAAQVVRTGAWNRWLGYSQPVLRGWQARQESRFGDPLTVGHDSAPGKVDC
jgi:LmbE family N-acetylglucosaminyl deacetylase